MGVAQEKVDYHKRFIDERKRDISQMARDEKITELGRLFIKETLKYKYSLNFTWLGRPIIQLPQDIIAVQEIIWEVKPDLIIETGIAHGGSLIFHASLLELIDGDGIVLGIDIDIRKHNRLEIEKHPMFKRIRMIEGSSVDQPTVDRVHDFSEGKGRILVILDSNHTHDHVLRELELYSPLVTKGSYLIVLDTVIEDLPEGSFPDRPWGRGNNPRTAVWEFLKTNGRFEIDRNIQNKLVITSAPDGYLKCIKEWEG
jgi:cephalosporin hydroxylase